MKTLISIILINIFFIISGFSQTIDTAFFPLFQAYPDNPVIKYGDGFVDAAWNDPTVLKENGQYVMYASASAGISVIKVKIYRLISTDGYSWTLSPQTPVVQPDSGTYYGGGTETPSVVFFNGEYHMYMTVYPGPYNAVQDFTIGHAISADGISWLMDTGSVLESTGSPDWMGDIVGEPGAIVYHDSLFLFFTAAGVQNGSSVQSIGLIASSDGTNFGTAIQAVTRPDDVYPASDNWFGLSTPSALAINDSIYLFTDVAKMINGGWTQVALHQFKSYGNLNKWYHSSIPIHTRDDFSWTNGNYLSEIRSITPLMDDNGRLRIWYAGNHIGDISGTDTTYHITADSAGIHVDPEYWGIGTSEYQFSGITSVNDFVRNVETTIVYPSPASEFIIINSSKNGEWTIINSLGQNMYHQVISNNKIDVSSFPDGIYFLISNGTVSNLRFVIRH